MYLKTREVKTCGTNKASFPLDLLGGLNDRAWAVAVCVCFSTLARAWKIG
jgi:hypothetical protein